MTSLSFDPMVALYDETRAFDERCFAAALDFIVARFPPRRFRRLFEPGIGTGRIAVPLAERGYQVTGVDISAPMLALLGQRLRRSPRRQAVWYQRADATLLPYRHGAFDMGIVVHLFYFIPDWRRAADELFRVVGGDGPIISMWTGFGKEVPLLNDRYKALCGERGYRLDHIGCRSNRDFIGYAVSLGWQDEWVKDRWQWTARIPLEEGIRYIRSRAYSYTTVAPDAVHRSVVEQIESEMRRQFGDLSHEVEVPNQITLVLLTRDTAGGR
jgi:SAM-dependent methyltransferase